MIETTHTQPFHPDFTAHVKLVVLKHQNYQKSICKLGWICAFPPLIPPNPSPLFSSTSLSVCISYSSTSWHEHSSHTEMMKGWWEMERKKARKRPIERQAEGGRCTRMRVLDREREMGRDEAKAYQIVPLLLQHTITYVFIVLWTHTSCLCRGQCHCGNEWGTQTTTLCMYSGEQHRCTVHTESTASCGDCAWSKLVSTHRPFRLYHNRYGAETCGAILD